MTPAPVDPLPAAEPPKSPVKPALLTAAEPAIPVIVKSSAQPVPLPAAEPAIPVISDPKVSTSTASENGNKHNPPPAPVAPIPSPAAPIPSTPKDGNQHNPPPVPVAPTTTASEDARKPVNINDAPPAPVVPETKGNSTAVWVQEEYLKQFLLRQFGDGVNSFVCDSIAG